LEPELDSNQMRRFSISRNESIASCYGIVSRLEDKGLELLQTGNGHKFGPS
jgi:hypothetical protein